LGFSYPLVSLANNGNKINKVQAEWNKINIQMKTSLKVIHKKTKIKQKSKNKRKLKQIKKHEKETLLKFGACPFEEKHLNWPN
jgi:hypothetical protein